MRLNSIFASNMVFAKNQPIRIFGEGKGEAMVTFAGKTKAVISLEDNWLVEFPSQDVGGPYQLIFTSNGQEIVLEDIYVGEVYLFAGQSNMQFKVKDGEDESSLCESNDKLRLFSTDRIEKTDLYTSKDGWVKAEKKSVEEWSALAYYTGIKLAKNKNVAVGIISCHQGASVIESWVRKGLFQENGIELLPNEKHRDHFDEVFAEWNDDGTLYDFALSQIIPFSLSGVVWYQGESDTSIEEAQVYDKELALLINLWREDFKNKELPFVIVQIADYISRNDDAWKTVQDAQYKVQSLLENVKTVISADVSDNNSIHPPKKNELAKRIAKAFSTL